MTTGWLTASTEPVVRAGAGAGLLRGARGGVQWARRHRHEAADPGGRFPADPPEAVSAPALIYSLCLLASVACAALLGRAYVQHRPRLQLCTAVRFWFFG